MPSILEDAEKSSHNIPFSPTTETPKNVGFPITCVECSKQGLLHSKDRIKRYHLKEVKRILLIVDLLQLSIWVREMTETNDTYCRTFTFLKNCFICINKSPLKVMKKASYFILKALFVLKIFKFLA